MNSRIRHAWTGLRGTFWFVPALMVAGAVLLAVASLAVDTGLTGTDLPGWLKGGGADGARALLSTVAGSVVTVAGVAFSITIVALVLASTQFGPRLLSLFMRDVVSQATLGVFTGTFVFCLLVLRSIRGPDEGGEFVPQLSVSIAVGLTLLSVAVLVFFFHHVAVAIQAPRLVSAVARDLDHAIDRLAKPVGGRPGPAPSSPDAASDDAGATVLARETGYVQVSDDRSLFALAEAEDLHVRLLTRPGLFVVSGNPIAIARPGARLTDAIADRVRATMIIGPVRTSEDDIEYSIRQLVEVALRALSPAINDPFTAMAAIDWLGAAIGRLAETDLPARHRYDDRGVLRITADVSTFGGIVHTVFSRIRHYGGTSPVVLNRLLEAVAAFGPRVRTQEDRLLIRDETEAVLRMGRDLITSQSDLRELERRHTAALAALGAQPGHVEDSGRV